MADHLTIKDLKERLSNPDHIAAEAFPILQAICIHAARSDAYSQVRVQDLVLRALEHRSFFGTTAPILDGLVRHLGLFPYLEPDGLGLADTLAYEFHRPLNMGGDVVFHRVQAEVYRYLLSGENVILSAPASFGKSLIIDAMIASGRFRHIAIVVPTIALIDETRRRLSCRFSEIFKIITHGSQRRADRNLFVMTQERILEEEELEPIEFFVIDEFYKLQPRPEDVDRSLLLNQAFYRLYKTGAQFYLLGPNIRRLTALPKRIRYHFIVTDYKTVASEVVRVKPCDGDLPELVRLCSALSEPTLIYCSSPARVRGVVDALMSGGIGKPQPKLKDASDWIGSAYHPEWLFGRALRCGIGMHHGRLPRTLSQFVVRAFNDERVQFLVCTSTLIEGVNTKAKNVVIFDNKVAKRKFDHFTYNNILGRSGRMFEHFVGRVYIFHDPPAEQLPIVDIPVLTQPEDVPESLLVQVEDDDLVPGARKKVAEISKQDLLDMETIKKGRGLDPRAQIELAREISERVSFYWPLLTWTRVPSWDQLVAVCGLIWEFLVPDDRTRSGVSSGRQLAFRIDRLRKVGGASPLMKAELASREDEAPDEVVDEVMDFLRNWANFAFPRYLLALDRIQRAVFLKLGRRPGDYGYFAAQVENWFADPALMALDEYGIPVQVGQKLAAQLRPEGDLDAVLDRLRGLDVEELPLSRFEKSLVAEAKIYI